MKKLHCRVIFKAEVEFTNEDKSFFANVSYVKDSSDGLLNMGITAYRITKIGSFDKKYNLNEITNEERLLGKQVGTLSSVQHNAISPSVEHPGGILTLAPRKYSGLKDILLNFFKLERIIYNNANPVGKIASSGSDYVLEIEDGAPEALAVFLCWGLIYGRLFPVGES